MIFQVLTKKGGAKNIGLVARPSPLALGHLFSFLLSRKTGMASAVGVESSSLLQAPRPLDVAMPAPTATIALNATATVKEGAPTAASPPGDASTALKLADCIVRVSAALAELGATVEALKGKRERREVTWLDISARERESLARRVGGFQSALADIDCGAGGLLRLLIAFSLFSMPRCDIRDQFQGTQMINSTGRGELSSSEQLRFCSN